MADWRHIENRFLAISRRHIGRSTRNLEQRWMITCRCISSDQNCNFRKFKTADGRHFENSFISISQPWIIRFRSNLVHIYKFPFWAWKFDIKSEFLKFKMADRRHIENRFWLYVGAIFADLCKFRNGDEESRADIGQLTKMAIFTNSRWRTAAILKIALSWYLSRNYLISIKFGMPMQISIPRMAIWQKSKFFKFKMADGRHFENIFRCLHHSVNELMLPSQCLSTGALVSMKS